jgi:acetylglutamate kinase
LKNGIDYGYVGDVKKVEHQVIQKLIQAGLVPVFASMTHDGSGNLLNTNADTIASSVAVGMSHDFDVELNYCFELNGVLENVDDPESTISEINPINYNEFKSNETINSGMIPKIDNAFDALKAGVKAVRIMNALHIVDLAEGEKKVGTLILK